MYIRVPLPVKAGAGLEIEYIPFLSFVLVTTFTPGPNNISSASMGLLHGYHRSLGYMLGISAGFFCIMLLCAYVSSTILQYLPLLEPILRIIGALYILWLAWHTARASYAFDSSGQRPLGFKKGFLLQAFNPKVAVYGLTIYSTFLAPAAGNIAALSLFGLFFAFMSFCSISTWALCGAAIKNSLRRPKVRAAVNGLLVLLLIYCALDISGLLEPGL